MEILFATNLQAWGGGEKWMLTAAVAMRDRGHGVTLAAPEAAVIRERAEAAGLDTLAVPFTRDFDPVSWWRVFRHCRSCRVEVLCLNMDRVLRIAGGAARTAGVKVVLPRRGSEFPLKGHLNYRWHYQRVATGVIVNSQATARTLCRDISWRPPGAVHVIHNGLDLTPFKSTRPSTEVRSALGLTSEDLLLINVGELTARKNAALLVSVLPALRREFPGVHVLLVGEGPERENLLAQARQLGVADAVHLLGFRDDVPDLIAASDVLVHPARVEGFGFAVAEGMAAGLPTVVTDASSLPEIVTHGATGFLFPVDDGPQLEMALGRYLTDPQLRAAHGEAGRKRVQTEFEIGAKMIQLENLFQTELARG